MLHYVEEEMEGRIMAKLTTVTRDRITAKKFAFPKQRKEPLENATHVRNAVARFNQVKGATEAERRQLGSAYRLLQSDTEWNLRMPPSANIEAYGGVPASPEVGLTHSLYYYKYEYCDLGCNRAPSIQLARPSSSARRFSFS